MVEIQIYSLTPNLTFDISFDHNFWLIAPNGQCKFIFKIYILKAFQWYKELYIWTRFIFYTILFQKFETLRNWMLN